MALMDNLFARYGGAGMLGAGVNEIDSAEDLNVPSIDNVALPGSMRRGLQLMKRRDRLGTEDEILNPSGFKPTKGTFSVEPGTFKPTPGTFSVEPGTFKTPGGTFMPTGSEQQKRAMGEELAKVGAATRLGMM